MLIKTFKFLTKEKTLNTMAFKEVQMQNIITGETWKEFRPIQNYYRKNYQKFLNLDIDLSTVIDLTTSENRNKLISIIQYLKIEDELNTVPESDLTKYESLLEEEKTTLDICNLLSNDIYESLETTNKLLLSSYINSRKQLIKDSIEKILDSIDDHVTFPLSFSTLANTIVSKYVDLMIQKYRIPTEEQKDRIKIKVLSATDNVTSENYIIYVCAFCGISYKGGLTNKEFIDGKVQESIISDDSVASSFNVGGEIIIITPDLPRVNNLPAELIRESIQIEIEVRDKTGILINTYYYNYVINDIEHSFTNNVYLNGEKTMITVPPRGKVFFKLTEDAENYIKILYDIVNSEYNNYFSYSMNTQTQEISPTNYPKVHNEKEDYSYLNIGQIKIKPNFDNIEYYGTVNVYNNTKIFVNPDELPLKNVPVYVSIFKNENGIKVLNTDYTDKNNPKPQEINSGDSFSFDISSEYPYIEFSLSSAFVDDMSMQPVDSYFYRKKFDNTTIKESSIINEDVNLYLIELLTYKLNIVIPSPDNSISGLNDCILYCYYDDLTNTKELFHIDITLNSELSVKGYEVRLPKYSRIIIKSADGKYTSKLYTVEYEDDFMYSSGILTEGSLMSSRTYQTIELYPLIKYKIGTQHYYGNDVKISYIDENNQYKEFIIKNEYDYSSNLRFNEDKDIIVTQDFDRYIFKFYDSSIINPMPGTPVFISALNRLDNDIDRNYSNVNKNHYCKNSSGGNKSYIVNGKTYSGHFIIDNNCDTNLSNIKYISAPVNYYLSFNEYDRDTDTPSVNRYIKIYGSLYVGQNYNSGWFTYLDDANSDVFLFQTYHLPCGDTELKLYEHTVYYKVYNKNNDDISNLTLENEPPDYDYLLYLNEGHEIYYNFDDENINNLPSCIYFSVDGKPYFYFYIDYIKDNVYNSEINLSLFNNVGGLDDETKNYEQEEDNG